MKSFRWIVGLLLLVYLLTGVYQIRPEERAVVKRFGRIVARPGPGLWVGLPWGMDRVERVPIAQVQRVTIGYQLDDEGSALAVPAGLLLTGDENLVTLRVHIEFAVAEGDASLDDYVLQRSGSDSVVAREAEAALTEWSAGRPFDRILLAGSDDLPRWLVPRLQARIEPFHLGIRIQNASVAFTSPPEGVRRDFERVNQAEAVNRTREFRATQERTQRLREAENVQLRMRLEASAYAESSKALAIAEADGFRKRIEQYHEQRKQVPEMLNLIWWDEMTRTMMALKERGRLDILDQYLGPDGLDLLRMQPVKKK